VSGWIGFVSGRVTGGASGGCRGFSVVAPALGQAGPGLALGLALRGGAPWGPATPHQLPKISAHFNNMLPHVVKR